MFCFVLLCLFFLKKMYFWAKTKISQHNSSLIRAFPLHQYTAPLYNAAKYVLPKHLYCIQTEMYRLFIKMTINGYFSIFIHFSFGYIFMPLHQMMPGVYSFSVFMYIRDPARLRLRHLYQVEFCSYIVRYPTAGAYCGHISSWGLFIYHVRSKTVL